MLHLKGLTKSFTSENEPKKVLNGITIKVKKGQVFGFLGLNGEGKSTTVKIIGTLLFADKGSVLIDAQPHDALVAKQKIGLLPENPQFHSHLRAEEVLTYAGELFGLDRSIIAERVPALLREVGLDDVAKRPVRRFSKGMLQRLGMAVALVNDPELLVLDEPLDGLDPLGRLDFKRLIKRLKKEGKTVFFSTHILSDVEEICDEVAILHNGKIIAQGSPKSLVGRSRKSLETVFVELVK